MAWFHVSELGSDTTNSAPPFLLDTETVPWCNSTISLVMASPKPVPCALPHEANGVKRLASTCSGIPPTLSWMIKLVFIKPKEIQEKLGHLELVLKRVSTKISCILKMIWILWNHKYYWSKILMIFLISNKRTKSKKNHLKVGNQYLDKFSFWRIHL